MVSKNPYHKQHIAEFSEMMDERIQAVVPQMIQEQQDASGDTGISGNARAAS